MTKKKERSFREARERLDEILAEIEGEAGDVDELAARVKEASELIRFCRDRLGEARQQVTQVVADLATVEQSVAAEDSDDDPEDDDEADERQEEKEEGAEDEGAGSLPF